MSSDRFCLVMLLVWVRFLDLVLCRVSMMFSLILMGMVDFR